MENQEILEKLREILSVVKPQIDVKDVTPDTLLANDLGIDSLSMMLMALAIEDKFGFRFDTVKPFITLGEVCDYIKASTDKVEKK